MVVVDLNADLGEGFPFDEELLDIVTSANVACGFHAGDRATMRTACEHCVAHGVRIGAQPSYRDREGFGRRDLGVSVDTLIDDLEEQVAALLDAAARAGAKVAYLKPHGALYNRAAWDADRAGAVVEVASRHGLPVLGLPGSELLRLAELAGLTARREFFADRGYDDGGRLVPRGDERALVTDPAVAAARVRTLVERGTVLSVSGRSVPVAADSICVHGDTPGAVAVARGVRGALAALGVPVAAVA
ncbi:MAG TPA: 5-oxoprolinase subunit PxpA [Nocardioidaceae bacterium]|nr:5-oxoprolinase subunit PxpA [Nocardioidaceae bacterium]